jgi:hypothetical protein
MIPAPRYAVTLDTTTEPGKHWYKIDKPGYEKLPGVTTPLSIIDKSTPLMIWARNVACDLVLMRAQERHVRGSVSVATLTEIVAEARRRPDRLRDEAADLGTIVHGFLDDYAYGRPVDLVKLPPTALPAMAAFLDWLHEHDIELLSGDTKVGSLVHHYGGSLDALGRRRSDGKILLIDYKTSNGTYDTHALQAAGGYHIALEETYGIVADEAWVVRFSKKLPVTFGAYQVADIARSRKAWLLALELWREMQTPHFISNKKPRRNKTK